MTRRRRVEQAGIEPGPDAWDAEMLEYSFVVDSGSRRDMLYNGNNYGRCRIGVATLGHGT